MLEYQDRLGDAELQQAITQATTTPNSFPVLSVNYVICELRERAHRFTNDLVAFMLKGHHDNSKMLSMIL